jgi:hypothetical protein
MVSAASFGLDRTRVGLVHEDEPAGVVACPDRGGQGVDQRAHGGDVVELLLVALRQLGELVFDAADLSQPQDRAPADDLALGLDDVAGERGDRHGEAHAARAQRVDRTFHLAGGSGFEQVPKASTRGGASAPVTSVGSPMISGSSAAAGQAMRICGSDSSRARARSISALDAMLFARGGLYVGEAVAGAHQQDRGDHGEAEIPSVSASAANS